MCGVRLQKKRHYLGNQNKLTSKNSVLRLYREETRLVEVPKFKEAVPPSESLFNKIENIQTYAR